MCSIGTTGCPPLNKEQLYRRGDQRRLKIATDRKMERLALDRKSGEEI